MNTRNINELFTRVRALELEVNKIKQEMMVRNMARKGKTVGSVIAGSGTTKALVVGSTITVTLNEAPSSQLTEFKAIVNQVSRLGNVEGTTMEITENDIQTTEDPTVYIIDVSSIFDYIFSLNLMDDIGGKFEVMLGTAKLTVYIK